MIMFVASKISSGTTVFVFCMDAIRDYPSYMNFNAPV